MNCIDNFVIRVSVAICALAIPAVGANIFLAYKSAEFEDTNRIKQQEMLIKALEDQQKKLCADKDSLMALDKNLEARTLKAESYIWKRCENIYPYFELGDYSIENKDDKA